MRGTQGRGFAGNVQGRGGKIPNRLWGCTPQTSIVKREGTRGEKKRWDGRRSLTGQSGKTQRKGGQGITKIPLPEWAPNPGDR